MANDPLKGKVLVPKLGKTVEFQNAFQQMVKIAQGPLGWEGHAEMMISLGAFSGTKEEVIDAIQQAFLADIMDYGEWITEEEAKKREVVGEVLYGEPNVPTTR